MPCNLVRRYKRFLADVRLPNGESLTVHCPNSGSMKNCQPPDARCWISDSKNPKRKLRHTLELVEVAEGVLACVNTQRPNHLAEEAILAGIIEPLRGYPTLRREVRYGAERSRIDILLEDGDRLCYVEVKNVTLRMDEVGTAKFPDAVTTRGAKHLRELMAMKAEGHRAVMLFCVSLTDAVSVAPEDDIDPKYGQALRQAAKAGVELLAYRVDIDPQEGLWMRTPLPVLL